MEVEFILIAQRITSIVVVLVRFSMVLHCASKEQMTQTSAVHSLYMTACLHSRYGTVVYASRYQDSAYWRDDEVEEDIGYYLRELGEAPTFLTMPTRDELPNAVIATWGKIVLEPVDGASQKILAAGKNPKIGALIDFLGNYELSTKNDLPVYRVSGGAGFHLGSQLGFEWSRHS